MCLSIKSGFHQCTNIIIGRRRTKLLLSVSQSTIYRILKFTSVLENKDGKRNKCAYGHGESNEIYMCVVTRVGIGFGAGYHHVKVDVENKNTLLKIHY